LGWITAEVTRRKSVDVKPFGSIVVRISLVYDYRNPKLYPDQAWVRADSVMKTFRCLAFALTLAGFAASATHVRAQSIYTAYAFTNFVGQPGSPGSLDGVGAGAQFNIPHAIAIDAATNLYVSDTFNYTIRKITPAGSVSTIAGTPAAKGYCDGFGVGAAPRFTTPIGLSVDTNGNLYVGDSGNQTIRKVTAAGVVTTVAGQAGVTGSTNGTGTGTSALFSNPEGTTADSAGNIYVADNANRTIRKITPAGVVTTFAGSPGLQGTNDGVGSAARFISPNGLAVDSADNIYVADVGGHTIRKITSAASVSTLAGLGQVSGTNNGVGSAARFTGPQDVAVDAAANVYVSDTGNQTIRKITPDGTVSTLAGVPGQTGNSDGTNGIAHFSTPRGLAVDSLTNVYIADSANSTIRKMVFFGTNAGVSTLAGTAGQNGSIDGPGGAARFHFPYGLAVDSAGNIYAMDRQNDDIRKITPDGNVTTFAGVPGQSGSADGTGAAAQFNGPEDLTVDPAGNIYVVEFFNNTVREIHKVGTNWVVTTLAGCAACGAGTNDGIGSAARFSGPFGLTRDNSGNLYVADTGNFTIRKLTPSGTNWMVTTFAGKARTQGAVDDIGGAARFSDPHDLVADAGGDLFVTDGNAIRKISPAGMVTTLAGCPPPGCTNAIGSTDGPGGMARFDLPRGLALDSFGSLYLADSGNDTIRKLTPAGADWMVTTLAGNVGQTGFADGVGTNALFNQPTGVAVDGAGILYVVDSAESRITRGSLAPVGTPLEFVTNNGSLAVSNGVFHARLIGPSANSLILEASTDLRSWTPIQTNGFPTGSLSVTVPLTAAPYLFFRARVGP
jgi:sugar lactone lactonase YvrE